MKKNKMMRVASALLVAVLMTTSVISGTFAKYVTQDSATDTARVAKWGVTVEVTGEEAFAEKYNDEADAAGTQVVSSVSGEDVLAPGTHGVLSTVAISGSPEVAFYATTRLKLDLTDWVVDGDDYCPIVFMIGGDTYGMTGIKDYGGYALDHEFTSVALLEEAVINAIFTVIYGSSGWTSVASTEPGYEKQVTVEYKPTSPLNVTSTSFSWYWAFEGNDDNKDTKLGKQAAEGNESEIDFAMQIIAEQAD